MSCCLAACAWPNPCCKRPACNNARSLAAPVPNSASCTPARPLPSAPKAVCWSLICCSCICLLRSNSASEASITCDWYGDIKSCTPCWKDCAPVPTPDNCPRAIVPNPEAICAWVCAWFKNGWNDPTPDVAKFCACCCNASWPATCGASPAKFCCLVVKSWAALCLAAKSAADSPACCEIPAIPVDTTGTPDCAVTCFAKSCPKSWTNCAGTFCTVWIAIILLPLIFVMFETFV